MKTKILEVLARAWRKGNLCVVLVGMRMSKVIMEKLTNSNMTQQFPFWIETQGNKISIIALGLQP